MSSKRKTKAPKGITRRQFLKVAGAASAGFVLGACVPSETAAPVATPTEAPTVIKPRQDIIMGIGSDVTIMDSRIMVGAQAMNQQFHVIEQMLYPDNEGKQTGILASEWEPVTAPPGWRFKLRPGITFHNGEPFDAQSVKYTIESILDPANESWVHSDPRSRLSSIKEVRVEDDLTVALLTETLNRSLPIQLYLTPMLPPKYAAAQGKEFGVNPIGTGHYKFVEYRPGEHLVLEANREYHGYWDGPAKNDTVTFRFLPETATRLSALEAGEVHLIDGLSPDAIERVREHPDLDVLSTPSNRINGMFFHCGREPFNNVKARLAVAYAIDREALVQEVMGGLTEVAGEPFSAGTLGVVGESFAPYAYDLGRARQYFAEAGLGKGAKIKIGGPVGRYMNDKQVTTAVASMVAEVGFEPEIEQLEWGTYWTKAAQEGEYDMFYVGWATRGYDPADFNIIYTGWGDDNAGITHFVEQNARVVELYDLANGTLSQQEAEGYYKELSHLLWDNVPVAQMFYEPNVVGINRKLKGWFPRHDTDIYLWTASLA
jgi:peptide/nickel transport system substrate-binding protein